MSPHFQSEIKIIKTSLDRFLALRQLGPLECVRTPNFDQSQTANQNYNLFRLRPHVTRNYDKLSISKLHFLKIWIFFRHLEFRYFRKWKFWTKANDNVRINAKNSKLSRRWCFGFLDFYQTPSRLPDIFKKFTTLLCFSKNQFNTLISNKIEFNKNKIYQKFFSFT